MRKFFLLLGNIKRRFLRGILGAAGRFECFVTELGEVRKRVGQNVQPTTGIWLALAICASLFCLRSIYPIQPDFLIFYLQGISHNTSGLHSSCDVICTIAYLLAEFKTAGEVQLSICCIAMQPFGRIPTCIG